MIMSKPQPEKDNNQEEPKKTDKELSEKQLGDVTAAGDAQVEVTP
jgi:hypothetical protein